MAFETIAVCGLGTCLVGPFCCLMVCWEFFCPPRSFGCFEDDQTHPFVTALNKAGIVWTWEILGSRPKVWFRYTRYIVEYLSTSQYTDLFALQQSRVLISWYSFSKIGKFGGEQRDNSVEVNSNESPNFVATFSQVVESLDPLGRWPSFLRPIFCRKLLKDYIESSRSGLAHSTGNFNLCSTPEKEDKME